MVDSLIAVIILLNQIAIIQQGKENVSDLIEFFMKCIINYYFVDLQ